MGGSEGFYDSNTALGGASWLICKNTTRSWSKCVTLFQGKFSPLLSGTSLISFSLFLPFFVPSLPSSLSFRWIGVPFRSTVVGGQKVHWWSAVTSVKGVDPFRWGKIFVFVPCLVVLGSRIDATEVESSGVSMGFSAPTSGMSSTLPPPFAGGRRPSDAEWKPQKKPVQWCPWGHYRSDPSSRRTRKSCKTPVCFVGIIGSPFPSRDFCRLVVCIRSFLV